MTVTLRKADERGRADFGWLDSRHTFSFGQYHDPKHMGFGPLRVINDDRVKGGAGFGTHGHADMEIISIVFDGALEHKDSLGTGSVIKPGEVQRMTAGSGIQHSEYNASKVETVHFLQIWIEPEKLGLQPSYEQKAFEPSQTADKLCLFGSPDGREGSVTIHQDVDLYGTTISPGITITHHFKPQRKGWLQVVSGSADVAGQRVATGDGLAIQATNKIEIIGVEKGELLLFDMSA